MAEGVSTTILRYQFDDAAGNKAKAGVAGISRATETLTAQMNRLAAQSQLTSRELDDLRTKIRSGDLQGKDLDAAIYRALQLEEQLAKTNEQLDKLGQPRKLQIQDEISAFKREGQAQSFAVSSVRGLLPGGGGDLANTAQAAFDLLDTIPKMGASFDVLKQSIIDNINTIGKGKVGAIGAIAALTLVIQLLQQRAEETRKAAFGELEARRQALDLIVTGNKTELEERRRTLETQLRIAEQAEDEARRFQEQFKEGIRAAFGDVGLAIAEANAALGTNNTELKATADNLAAAEEATRAARLELKTINTVLNDGQFITRTAAEAEDELRKARQQVIDDLLRSEIQIRSSLSAITGGTADAARSRLNALEAERQAILEVKARGEASAEALEGFNKRLDEIGASADVVRSLLPGLEEIERRKKADEDRKDAEESLLTLASRAAAEWDAGMKRIEGVIKSGHKEIENAEKRLSETRLKLAAVEPELRAKIAEVNQAFMKDDLARLERHIANEQRIKRAAETQSLRDLRDHHKNLRTAEFAQDTAAFLLEQERFRDQQTDRKQDMDTAARDRLDSFEAERQKAREVRDERLAALNAESDKVRANLKTELDERQKAKDQLEKDIQDRVIAEKAAIETSIRNLVSSHEQGTNKMTATLKAGFDALEAAGINTFSGIIGELQRRASVFINQQAAASYYKPPVSSSGVPLMGGGGMAFAKGTLDTRRGIRSANSPQYMWGEDQRDGWTEAMIPYKQSEGIESELARLGLSNSVVIDLSGSDFGAVTRSEVESIVRNAVLPVVERTLKGFQRVRQGRA